MLWIKKVEMVESVSRWREFLFHRGCSCDVTTILKAGLIAGGRNNKEGRPTIFFTLLNPVGDNPDEELGDDLSKPKEVHYHSKWKYTGRRLLDQFNPSTRHRITILADKVSCLNCIQLCAGRLHLKVISHKGERTQFERLPTPRPTPKIVLESAWQSQQQQQQQDTSESAPSIGRSLI